MHHVKSKQTQAGFSLLEVAVVLVIATVIGLLLVSLLPLGNRVVSDELVGRELARSQQALLGHLRSHHRLPDADSDGDGHGNPNASEGWLPVADLGLPAALRIAYRAAPALQAPMQQTFSPLLPSSIQHQVDGNINGLDLCMQLLQQLRDDDGVAGLPLATSIHLVHARNGADLTALPAARLPGMPGADNTAIMAIGPGELATRLSCPDRLARVQGSAQAALAADSALRVSRFNQDYRQFDVEVAKLVKLQADAGMAFAVLGLATALADMGIAITLAAAGWPPDGIGIPVGIGETANGLATIGFAGYQIEMARQDIKGADDGLDESRQNLVRAQKQFNQVSEVSRQAGQQAVALDKAGLEP